MFPTILTVSAVLIASLAYLFSAQQGAAEQRLPYIQGRNNTALFIANYEHGLSNVFIATAFSMLENFPDIELHYASWEKVKKKTDRISKFAKVNNPAAPDVVFHQIKGQGYATAIEALGVSMESVMNEPGWRGIGPFARNMQDFICPWEPEPFYDLYTEIGQLIDEVDPAVIVVDTLFRPAIDATRDKHRQHVILTPNTHVDNFLAIQPYGSMFWKYPAMSSGFKFPLKWSEVLENVYINARYIYAVMAGPEIRRKQAALKEYGVKEPIDFMHMHRPDVPWITMHTEGASIPVEVVPGNVTSAGPILIHSAPAEKQDPELVAWMKRAPTVLINLGSSVSYTEWRAVAFAAAIADILEQSNIQIIWKFNKFGEYSDDYLMPLKPYLGDRVLMPDWLGADPYALLESGLISVSVHHGGSGCYHEAISAGVAQVVLPLWADLYSFAALAESLDVGLWGCRETSPKWTQECLSTSILHVINNSKVATNAKALGETVRARGKGRDIAAKEVAKYARVTG